MQNLPLIISTWSFGQRANQAAWPTLSAGGHSLDAVEHACTAVELDSEVDSIGFGGLPDLNGDVTLDASVMVSPAQCGSVCMVRRCLHVTSLARMVMEKTNHRMLAGDGADYFAEQRGLAEQSLLSDEAAGAYSKWIAKKPRKPVDQVADSGLAAHGGIRPVDRDGSGRLFTTDLDTESRWLGQHDTIGTLAIDSDGVLAGACSTSGSAYKLPGRVGDSPIIGAGLYVDPDVGGATATGTGELMIGTCASFLIVELMRGGASPTDAIRVAVERIDHTHTIESYHQAAFIALDRAGQYGHGALRSGFKIAIRDELRDEIVDPNFVLRND